MDIRNTTRRNLKWNIALNLTDLGDYHSLLLVVPQQQSKTVRRTSKCDFEFSGIESTQSSIACLCNSKENLDFCTESINNMAVEIWILYELN